MLWRKRNKRHTHTRNFFLFVYGETHQNTLLEEQHFLLLLEGSTEEKIFNLRPSKAHLLTIAIKPTTVFPSAAYTNIYPSTEENAQIKQRCRMYNINPEQPLQ